MLAYDDQFKQHYNFYQSFLTAFDTKDLSALQSLLNQAYAHLSKPMQTSIKTLKKHLVYITNTFASLYSNGRIEGIHNKIKVLNRIAYGYRNLENFID